MFKKNRFKKLTCWFKRTCAILIHKSNDIKWCLKKREKKTVEKTNLGSRLFEHQQGGQICRPIPCDLDEWREHIRTSVGWGYNTVLHGFLMFPFTTGGLGEIVAIKIGEVPPKNVFLPDLHVFNRFQPSNLTPSRVPTSSSTPDKSSFVVAKTSLIVRNNKTSFCHTCPNLSSKSKDVSKKTVDVQDAIHKLVTSDLWKGSFWKLGGFYGLHHFGSGATDLHILAGCTAGNAETIPAFWNFLLFFSKKMDHWWTHDQIDQIPVLLLLRSGPRLMIFGWRSSNPLWCEDGMLSKEMCPNHSKPQVHPIPTNKMSQTLGPAGKETASRQPPNLDTCSCRKQRSWRHLRWVGSPCTWRWKSCDLVRLHVDLIFGASWWNIKHHQTLSNHATQIFHPKSSSPPAKVAIKTRLDLRQGRFGAPGWAFWQRIGRVRVWDNSNTSGMIFKEKAVDHLSPNW